MAKGKAKSLPSKGKGKARPVGGKRVEAAGKMPKGLMGKRGMGKC